MPLERVSSKFCPNGSLVAENIATQIPSAVRPRAAHKLPLWEYPALKHSSPPLRPGLLVGPRYLELNVAPGSDCGPNKEPQKRLARRWSMQGAK